jgi:hypothetical protein
VSGAWLLLAPAGAARELRPLVRAHERERPVRVLDGELVPELIDGAAGVLVVGDRRRSPRNAVPGAVLTDSGGRPVPVGWLPDVRGQLARFAVAAARVLRRSEQPAGPLAVLGQWEERFLRLADRMEARLAPFPVLRWTAERLTQTDLVRGLRAGLGVGVYLGHGRSVGWAGYHGLRARHLIDEPGEPMGALLSVTCLTASRWRTGLSFSEAVVLGGAAAGAVGAVAEVRHTDNMRWMLGAAEALHDGEHQLGPLLARALPGDRRTLAAYRIIGDPLAPLAGTAAGARRAARIWAPAPEERWA